MSKQPEYVEYAFSTMPLISTQEWIQENIEAFVQRWGGVDLATQAHVLHHGKGEDQMVAIFAIGHTRSAWARDLLHPFLHSDDPGVKWAAALSLGEMWDERARPVLVEMLQAFLPPPYTPAGEAGPDWFEMKQKQVARLLGQWGDPLLIPVLCETLARVWQIEQNAPAHQGLRTQVWAEYQDELAYALGQLDAFNALADLHLHEPAPRQRVWTVNMALGYLHAQACYKNSCLGIIADMSSGKHQDLHPILLHVLQQKSRLSSQEAAAYLQEYGRNYFTR